MKVSFTGKLIMAAASALVCASVSAADITGAGATFPYGKDPRDRNLRIAPTYPSLDEVETASALLCVCVRLAVVEKLLADQQ